MLREVRTAPTGKPGVSQTARLATAGDAPTIAALCLESARESGLGFFHAPDLRRRVREMLATGDATFVVAGSPPAAMAILRFQGEVWHDGPSAHVDSVFVSARARGWGLGRGVMTAAFGIAARRRAYAVFLNVNERNTAALRLYETLGFGDATRSNRWGGREILLVQPGVAVDPESVPHATAAGRDGGDRDGSR